MVMSTEPTVVPSAVVLRQADLSHGEATAKSKKKKPASSTKKSRGWGPFHSVLKERSMDFNLTLDVQNLQQEVRELTTLRDILSTRTMLRRHSPEGSLLHVVKEYLEVFRTGWVIHETGRKRLLGEEDQRAFLHSVMDPELDVGNGLRGPDVMAEQIILYSTFIKFIRVTLNSYDIVMAEDSVVIRTRAKLRFQVLRNTIEMIFPHILGDEWLVSQLVGQEVEPSIGITFSFNAEGKCCKYEFDVDFVGAFASLVKDSRKLELLLGRALIADNCMLGLIDEPLEVPHPTPHGEPDVHDVLYRIVTNYYLDFAQGALGDSQEDFLAQIFVSERPSDPRVGGKYVRNRWQRLNECFDVLEFHQTGAMVIEYGQDEMCVIQSTGSYTLGVTMHTLESTFPHVLPYSELVDKLVGNVLLVPSELVFHIETDTRRIARIVEHMDFVESLAMLLPSRDDLSFVLSQARLTLDGVRGVNLDRVPDTQSRDEEPYENLSSEATLETRGAGNARSMNMADILTT